MREIEYYKNITIKNKKGFMEDMKVKRIFEIGEEVFHIYKELVFKDDWCREENEIGISIYKGKIERLQIYACEEGKRENFYYLFENYQTPVNAKQVFKNIKQLKEYLFETYHLSKEKEKLWIKECKKIMLEIEELETRKER